MQLLTPRSNLLDQYISHTYTQHRQRGLCAFQLAFVNFDNALQLTEDKRQQICDKMSHTNTHSLTHTQTKSWIGHLLPVFWACMNKLILWAICMAALLQIPHTEHRPWKKREKRAHRTGFTIGPSPIINLPFWNGNTLMEMDLLFKPLSKLSNAAEDCKHQDIPLFV